MNTGTILIVEDNPDHQELLSMTFRQNKVANDIVFANDGGEALDYLFARGVYAARDKRQLPDLILMDIKLPKLSGIEVLKQIRANDETRVIPVVMLTSSGDEDDIVESLRSGANSYVRKPVDFNEFVEKTKQLHLYWMLINESHKKPLSKS